MEDPKIVTMQFSIEQLRDIAQGLDLLHTRCIDHSHALQTSDSKYSDLKKYFREKQVSLNVFMKEINNVLLNGKNPS